MFGFNEEVIVPLMIFSIPIIAITGGIISGIVKAAGRQRLVELAQRERIAAIERGIDPAKLPPLPSIEDNTDFMGRPYSARHRSQGLAIGGLVTTFAGLGIVVFLLLLRPEEDKAIWAVGLIPIFVGVALLISSWMVRPQNGEAAGSGMTRS
jgi:hypothetical protein